MKVTVKQQPEEFKPVTLEITLESREELEAIYRIIDSAAKIEDTYRDAPINQVAIPIFKKLYELCEDNDIETLSVKRQHQ
jgi:hypothetical protein